MPRRLAKIAATRPRRRSGLTLIEALVSTTLTVTAGAAILLAISSSLQTAEVALEQTAAHGLAQQLLDEVGGTRYVEPGGNPQQWPLGYGAGEGPNRATFDDLDDFVGFTAQPPVDPRGVALGADDGYGGLRHPDFRAPTGRLANWRTEIDVYYVDPTDLATRLPAGDTSYYRAVEVHVLVNTGGTGRVPLPNFAECLRMSPRHDPRPATGLASCGFPLRRGVTAIELLMALAVMVIVTAAVATLADAVQVSNQYGQDSATNTQHARVALERIAIAVRQAHAAGSEPGLVVLDRREDGWWFSDTLVVWRPSGNPANANGPPLMRELVVFCPDPDDPRRLVEITAPGDGTAASLEDLNTPDGRIRIEAMKRAAASEKVVLTDRLRVAETTGGQRGVVWFRRRVRPSLAQWEAWQAGGLAWEQMDWPLGLYGREHGIRQAWLRMELQLDGGNGAVDVPFFGSAALNYSLEQ